MCYTYSLGLINPVCPLVISITPFVSLNNEFQAIIIPAMGPFASVKWYHLNNPQIFSLLNCTSDQRTNSSLFCADIIILCNYSAFFQFPYKMNFSSHMLCLPIMKSSNVPHIFYLHVAWHLSIHPSHQHSYAAFHYRAAAIMHWSLVSEPGLSPSYHASGIFCGSIRAVDAAPYHILNFLWHVPISCIRCSASKTSICNLHRWESTGYFIS